MTVLNCQYLILSFLFLHHIFRVCLYANSKGRLIKFPWETVKANFPNVDHIRFGCYHNPKQTREMILISSILEE
jgi:hypothetical protein